MMRTSRGRVSPPPRGRNPLIALTSNGSDWRGSSQRGHPPFRESLGQQPATPVMRDRVIPWLPPSMGVRENRVCGTSRIRRSTRTSRKAEAHRQRVSSLKCAPQFRLILPAATAIGVRLRHASRESSGLGRRLSNTRITYPQVGDNPGKLGTIPHRSRMLERFVAESSGARGWVCGLSASRGFNRPPRLRRVRAVGAVARRWTLRHESRPYGAQQSRKLHNVPTHDVGTPSAYALRRLFSPLKRRRKKGRVRQVPAAAVIPAARVVATFTEPKASVAWPVDSWVNRVA